MAGEHPTEPMLLAYVENELDDAERTSVEAHLAECEGCATDVSFARAGADALAGAPELEVPLETHARIERALPRAAPPGVAVRHRWVRVALPVAAALALVGGVTTFAVVNADRDGDEAAGLTEESADSAAGDDGAGSEAAPSEAQALQRVAVNPRELVRKLERRGFDARVENGTVVVRTERRRALERYLSQFPSGSVEIRVE